MATAEELLNSVLKNEASVLSATDAVFVIDGESRTINVPDSERLFGVEGDKDVERKYFQCPKIVGDNIDLSQHQIYVSYAFTTTENGTSFPDADGLYHCEDVEVSGDNITFSWLLSGNVFANPGFIAFKVMAKKSEGEELKTKWNTAPAIGSVLLTVPDGEEIAEEYPDIINQLLTKMESVEQIATPEAMQNYVNAYLQENPPSGVEIDDTLTQEGKAADAKITGDAIKNNSEKIDSLSKDIDYFNALIQDGTNMLSELPVFETGTIVSHIDGTVSSSYDFYKTSDFIDIFVPGTIYKAINTNNEVFAFFRGAYYNGDKQFTRGIVSGNDIGLNENEKYVKFTYDTRSGDIAWIGNSKAYEERIAKKVINFPTINPSNFYGGVIADRLSDTLNFNRANVEKIMSNKNLFNNFFQLNSVNIIDEELLQMKTTLDSSGNILSTNGPTGVIDVPYIKQNTKYSLMSGPYEISFDNGLFWLDSSGNVIGKSELYQGKNTVESPSLAYGVRLKTNYSNRPTTPTQGNLIMVEGEELPDYSKFTGIFTVNEKYLPSSSRSSRNWSMYNWIAIGDSRTAGYSNNMHGEDGFLIWDEDVAARYTDFIKYYTGINVNNVAKTGAAFCYREAQKGIPTMYEQAENVTEQTHIITVFGMSNDRIIGVSDPVYSPTNERDNQENQYDTSTFKGAVRQTIKNIRTKSPLAVIIFLVENDTAYDGGQSKKDMIEEICLENKIPTLNLSECAMTGTVSDSYLPQKYHSYTDGLHESVVGHRQTARAVMGEMSKYLW